MVVVVVVVMVGVVAAAAAAVVVVAVVVVVVVVVFGRVYASHVKCTGEGAATSHGGDHDWKMCFLVGEMGWFVVGGRVIWWRWWW